MVIQRNGNAPQFAALPPGLSTDGRIKLGHYRVITVISYHDRMSAYRRGHGCFRSRQKLADMLSMSLSSFAAFLNDLVQWDYLRVERHSAMRNTLTYRVNLSATEAAGDKTSALRPGCG
jgi:hypothetical protein